jgi:hypothetical protein
MKDNFEVSRRYGALWEKAAEAEHGPVIPTIEEAYVEGSLRPQVTSLSAEAGGQVIHLTNLEVTWRDKDATVLDKLAQLEELAA